MSARDGVGCEMLEPLEPPLFQFPPPPELPPELPRPLLPERPPPLPPELPPPVTLPPTRAWSRPQRRRWCLRRSPNHYRPNQRSRSGRWTPSFHRWHSPCCPRIGVYSSADFGAGFVTKLNAVNTTGRKSRFSADWIATTRPQSARWPMLKARARCRWVPSSLHSPPTA